MWMLASRLHHQQHSLPYRATGLWTNRVHRFFKKRKKGIFLTLHIMRAHRKTDFTDIYQTSSTPHIKNLPWYGVSA